MIREIIEFIFGSALFVNALLFIPQAIKICKEKKSQEVSLLTFGGFLVIQFAVVLHGIIVKDYLLIMGYLLSMMTCGSVVFFAFLYKRKDMYLSEEVSLEEILKQMPGHVYWKNREGINLGSNTNNWKDIDIKFYEDYKGKTDYELFPKHYADKLREADIEVMQTGQLKILEEGGEIVDETGRLYLSHKAPFRNKNNEIIGIVGVSLDITEARKKELERLAFLENIIALMPGHVYWVNRDNIYLGCNDNQAKSAQLSSRKEIVGKRNKELPWNFNAGILPEVLDNINQEVMMSGKAIMVEEPAVLSDGENALFLSNKAPIYNDDREVIGMVGISLDITALRKTEKQLQETKSKLDGMTLVSASIAHELRTPLGSLNVSAGLFKKEFSRLLGWYKEIVKEDSGAPFTVRQVEVLEKLLDSMGKETNSAFTFIDMLLISLNPAANLDKLEVFSMNTVIEEAIARYPFSKSQKELIEWKQSDQQDFSVRGERLLVIHVFFNLIKNALHHVAKASKGNIQIWLEPGVPYNKVYFKDTGTGIAADVLPHIFERFFSKTHHGAGVGLSFCQWVMENMGGTITCESVEGDYTLFILNFPPRIP